MFDRFINASLVSAQEIKFTINDLFSKCDQIRRKLRSHILKKSLMEHLIFCAMGFGFGGSDAS